MKRLFLLIVILLPANSALSQFDTMYVRIHSDTAEIWHKGDENCLSRWVSTVTVSNDSVLSLETDTSSMLATCDCYFTERLTLAGLPGGSYHALVFRQRLTKYNQWIPKDTIWYVGSIDFTITNQSGSTLTQSFRQSRCGEPLEDDVPAESPSTLPVAIQLSVFPNPFNPETTIEYWIPQRSQVILEVFDVLGRRVAVLADEKQPAGTHRVRFSTDGISSGVYVCRLRVGQQTTSHLLVAVR